MWGALRHVRFTPDFDRKSGHRRLGRVLLSSVIEEYDYARKRKPSCNCRHTKPLEQGQANWSQAGIDMWRKAAGYVDRILKGEKPADMPVQAPTKHQLVINLTTAKALGLDVPMHLQQIADEIIE